MSRELYRGWRTQEIRASRCYKQAGIRFELARHGNRHHARTKKAGTRYELAHVPVAHIALCFGIVMLRISSPENGMGDLSGPAFIRGFTGILFKSVTFKINRNLQVVSTHHALKMMRIVEVYIPSGGRDNKELFRELFREVSRTGLLDFYGI